jgi:chitinase
MKKALWFTILMAIASAVPAEEKAATTGEKMKIVAYYISWGVYDRNFFPNKIDYDKVTHINYAFANLNDKGEVIIGDPLAEGRALGPLSQLKRKNKELKTLISIGGWTWSKKFSDSALTEESRALFADSVAEFVYKHGFDGADIDWEYPTGQGNAGNIERPEDPKNFVLLLRKTREKLDALGKEQNKHYLLTIATQAHPRFVEGIDMKQVAEICDWINIMAYDYNGTWNKTNGHHAGLFGDPLDKSDWKGFGNVDAGVALHLKAGVPAKKLVVGVPFYGRSWKGCPPEKNGLYKECAGAGPGTWEDGVLDFHDLEAKYIDKNGFKRFWSEAAKAPYLYEPSKGIFITYDDAESMQHKVEYIKKKGLAGAMFWEITADKNKTLLDVLAKGLLQK